MEQYHLSLSLTLIQEKYHANYIQLLVIWQSNEMDRAKSGLIW
jgi:hypothetical protein